MARPLSVSDRAIFDATGRAVARFGPARLTLAHVAEAVGLTPAALVKRFGSKRGLLLAFVRQAPASVDECFVSVRAANASPLAALVAAATSTADHVRSPEELANSLAFLQIDLSDADFRKSADENGRRILAGYEALIRDALAAGELIDCDARQLARAIHAMVGGSMINWAIHRDGTLPTHIRRDVESLLAPLRRRRRARSRRA